VCGSQKKNVREKRTLWLVWRRR